MEQKRITKGPVAAISTTTRDKVEVDDETRHLSIWADKSPEQTTRIMEAALEEQPGLSEEELQVLAPSPALTAKQSGTSYRLPRLVPDP